MDHIPPEDVIIIGLLVGRFLITTCRGYKAIDVYCECLLLLNQLPASSFCKRLEQVIHLNVILFGAFLVKRGRECYDVGQLTESITCYERALVIHQQIGNRNEEAWSHCFLGRSLLITCQYDRAMKHFEEALSIQEIPRHERQRLAGRVYNNIGEVHQSRGNYEEACRYYKKALGISKDIGNEIEQAVSYNNLGTVNHNRLGKLDEALFFHEKALEIRKRKAKEYGTVPYRKAEGMSYNNIGGVFEARGEYQKALEYYEKSLAVSKEIKDRRLEGINLYFIGKVNGILGNYEKAIEHQERALKIKSEIGEKKSGVLTDLGCLYMASGDYEKAIAFNKKAIELCKEIGDLVCMSTCYNNLSVIYKCLGEYEKSIEYLEKSICIYQKTGVKMGLAKPFSNIGSVYLRMGHYQKSQEFIKKALKLSKETGDIQGEAASLLSLGRLYVVLGQDDKAFECGEKALKIAKEIRERSKEMEAHILLSEVHLVQGHNEKVIEYQHKALRIMKEIGIRDQQQFSVLQSIGLVYASQGEVSKACDFLLKGIENHQKTRASIEEETTKFSLDSQDFSCYKSLSWLLLCQGKVNEALFTLELGRGRSLVDLIGKKYGIQEAPGTNEATGSALKTLFNTQKRNFLFIAILQFSVIALWFVDKSGNIKFKNVQLQMGPSKDETAAAAAAAATAASAAADAAAAATTTAAVDDVDPSGSGLSDQKMQCEDRSLSAMYHDGPSAAVEQTPERPNQHGVREGEGIKLNDQEYFEVGFTYNSYSAYISPIVDLIDSPEIIIVPEGTIFQTPFASLKDENGKYLSERVRIRLIPSLTTLKLIQDSSADYHSQTGALIVGDPKVGPVEFNGKVVELSPLPKAREEAKMVSRLLGVPCLVGEDATKEKVLHRIQEVSLVHIAAHGDEVRGEIALAPNSSITGIPRKEDFMLTMKDIAGVGIRAKLVVLSCCHSASGKILTAEGVVGIARAFLGSGARSVLMSLWAVDDDATKAFMNIFYKCLIRENLSASEALHQAMKKTRESTLYNDVNYWAPFVLLGDDVSLNF